MSSRLRSLPSVKAHNLGGTVKSKSAELKTDSEEKGIRLPDISPFKTGESSHDVKDFASREVQPHGTSRQWLAPVNTNRAGGAHRHRLGAHLLIYEHAASHVMA